MKPFFSIVMPVYNAEEYLGTALDSVAGQWEEDWELVIVDDASTDRSAKICDEWADRDARIRVIHLPQNGGLSNARNVGMDAARGRYLMFMDSDDWVDADLLKTLREAVEDNQPELIVWGVTEHHYPQYGQPTCRMKTCPDAFHTSPEDIRRAALKLEKNTLLGYAWNKLYDRRLLERCGARFEVIPLIEDILFNLKILPCVQTMQVLSCAPYHYARRPSGSLTHRFIPDYYALNMRRVEEIVRLYIGWGMRSAVLRIMAPVYTRYAFSSLQRNCDPRAKMNHKARRKFVRDMFSTALYRSLRENLSEGAGVSGLAGRMLALENVGLCLAAGRMIYWWNAKIKPFSECLRRGGKKA